MTSRTFTAALVMAVMVAAGPESRVSAQTRSVPFDAVHWDLSTARDAKLVEHQGRSSLLLDGGEVLLKDVDFADGVIEVSVSGPGAQGFAFVSFRVQAPGESEEVYLRLHKSGSPDALQYAPSFHGVTSWQLHGPGDGWASVTFDRNAWTRLRLEIQGERLRAFVGDATEPALVARLRRPERRGRISLTAAPAAYFSDFRITPLAAGEASPTLAHLSADVPGTITSWELSPIFLASGLDPQRAPRRADHRWQAVTSEAGGLLNIARFLDPATVRPRGGPPGPPPPVTAYARTTIRSDLPGLKKLAFGYSDDVVIFLNGRPLFTGRSAFRSRDPLFQGMIGYHDALYLELERGENELVFAVTEESGGWGLMARLVGPDQATTRSER